MESIPQIATTELVQATAVRKARIKIFPFIFLLYINAYLDRVNVSFAAESMKKELGFTSDVFGFGAGIFFLGYFLLEIPGTWIVERWSARKWMARIMITWGIFTILMAFISTARQFYLVRFLIGLAEAGFFPGMIVYLSHWFTARERAQAVAIFMSAIPISNIVAGPISGAILNLSAWGLAGWRWLFILEGIPAIIFGVLTLFVLVDWPRDAPWLTEDERRYLSERFHKETETKQAVRHYRVGEVFFEREVLQLALTYFLLVVGSYGMNMWIPTLVKRLSGGSNVFVGLLTSLAYSAGLAGLLIIGRHSDRTGERKLHTAIPLMVSSVGFLGSVLAPNPGLAMAFVMLALAGLLGSHGPFWSMPTQFLSAESAAVAIGLINSVGNLGGFVGPSVVGYIESVTGSFRGGFFFLAASVFLSSVCAMLLRAPRPAMKMAKES